MTDQDKPLVHAATCVALGSRGVLIEGEPGSGKSSLALELIDRGAHLVGDDGVLLSREGGRLIAQPHPNTRDLLEVRNLGLLPFPAIDSVLVALRIVLDPAAARFIDAAESATLAGVRVPLVRLWPESGPLALKVELALAHYGIAER